jgi:hypothetical protein
MVKRLIDRRTVTAWLGLISLTWLGLANNIDVSVAIAGVVASIAAANSYEKRGKNSGPPGE